MNGGSRENTGKTRFANAALTYLDEYMTPSRGDWTLHRGGAVVKNGCEGCVVTDCFFDAVGGNGVFLDDYNKDCRISGNLFWNDIGHFVARVHPRPIRSAVFDYGLEQWQAMGYDIHSIFADPCFQDAAKGDFRLNKDSPAFDIGFAPFPLDEFGPAPMQGNGWEREGEPAR
jgi:hypothetical protein